MGEEPRKVRILIVDDEQHIRLLMKTLFESMNCEIVGMAANGKLALEVFRKERPDIVMMDINMPVMDGREALKIIKTESPETVVIMLSSLSSLEVVKSCLADGADNYLRKDLSLKEIKLQVKDSWLATRRKES